jgi:hypothetical protein
LGLNPRSNKNTYIKLICYLVETLVGFSKCTGCQSELSGWLCQVSPSRDGCLCCATQLFRKIYYVNNNSFTHIVPIHSGVEIISEGVIKTFPCLPFLDKPRFLWDHLYKLFRKIYYVNPIPLVLSLGG